LFKREVITRDQYAEFWANYWEHPGKFELWAVRFPVAFKPAFETVTRLVMRDKLGRFIHWWKVPKTTRIR
jgi:hypothetical protein